MTRKATESDIYVGRKIREARTRQGITQQQLGEKLELTFQQIQKYESGFNRVSAGKLYEIARTLELPVSYFFEAQTARDKHKPNQEGGSAQALVRAELAEILNKIDDIDVLQSLRILLIQMTQDET